MTDTNQPRIGEYTNSTSISPRINKLFLCPQADYLVGAQRTNNEPTYNTYTNNCEGALSTFTNSGSVNVIPDNPYAMLNGPDGWQTFNGVQPVNNGRRYSILASDAIATSAVVSVGPGSVASDHFQGHSMLVTPNTNRGAGVANSGKVTINYASTDGSVRDYSFELGATNPWKSTMVQLRALRISGYGPLFPIEWAR